MKLVERFIEFQAWPTCKKNVVLFGLALPLHLGCTLWAMYGMRQFAWVDNQLVEVVYWAWDLELFTALVLSAICLRLGYEGRWVMWLNIIVYNALMVVAISMFGFATTAFAAWVPALLVLVTVMYGPRVGLISFVYTLSLILVYLGLVETGQLPYAPALLDRSIDAQNNWLWVSQIFSLMLVFFAFCFVLVLLLISAQNLQGQRLEQAGRMLARSNELISRYVPSRVSQQILGDGDHQSFKPERAKITIFFSDLEGFTEASDKLDPEDLSQILNEYLSEMVQIAERYNTSINQFVGDGIMIFFGGLGDKEHADHALHAVCMALEMQRRIAELQQQWAERGITKPLQARMGINTGYASVGDFGSKGRKVYTAIGVQTSIAAGIHLHCRPGHILVRDATWALVEDKVDGCEKGELKLEGVHMPVHVYEVNGLKSSTLANHAQPAAIIPAT